MKKINLMGGLAAMATTIALIATPVPAFADEAHAVVDTSTIVLGEIDGNATVKTLQATGLQVNGKSVARYVKNPAKHWSPKKAKKVPFAKNYYAGVKSGKPFRLKKAKKFPDTYVGMAADMTEFDYAVNNKVKYAWQLFDVKNGQVRNRGFWTGKKWVGDCVNPKPSTPPTVNVNSLHIVKQFNGFKVNIAGRLSLWATTSAMVEVDCGSSRARAEFSAKAEAELEGSVIVKAKTRAQAIAKGVQALKIKYRNSQEAELKLRGDAALKLEGSAEAWCESDEEEPPPVVTEKPDVSVTPVACVNPGTTRDVTITVGNPNDKDDTAKVTYRGEVYTKPVGANSQVTFTLPNQEAGSYTGMALLVTANKSASFTVTVEKCLRTPGSLIEVEDVNDVLYGNTRTWRIRGMVPSGQTATLRVSAHIGTVAPSDKSITLASGAFDVKITYTAPTEGSSDTLTASLFGSEGQKDAEASDTFELRPNPVDPPR